MAEDVRRGSERVGKNGSAFWCGSSFRQSRSELDALPALSSVLLRMEKLLSAPVIDLRDLVGTAWSDPGVAARLLQKAIMEKSGDLPTRTETVLLVGAKAMRDLVKSTPFVLSSDPCAAQFIALRRHCFAVSLLSENFALAMGNRSADRAAMIGLLHHLRPAGPAIAGCLGDGFSESEKRTLLQIVSAADRAATRFVLRPGHAFFQTLAKRISWFS